MIASHLQHIEQVTSEDHIRFKPIAVALIQERSMKRVLMLTAAAMIALPAAPALAGCVAAGPAPAGRQKFS